MNASIDCCDYAGQHPSQSLLMYHVGMPFRWGPFGWHYLQQVERSAFVAQQAARSLASHAKIKLSFNPLLGTMGTPPPYIPLRAQRKYGQRPYVEAASRPTGGFLFCPLRQQLVLEADLTVLEATEVLGQRQALLPSQLPVAGK